MNVYVPCQGEARDLFLIWLYNLNIPANADWMLLGDFNFIRPLPIEISQVLM